MSGRITQSVVRALDGAARLLSLGSGEAAHINTGRRGEEAAYFHLRKLGYTMVARNWRSPRLAGELDLVGWDDSVLCIIEVKTRGSRHLLPAETAVDAAKQDELIAVGREFLRRLPDQTPSRADVVSVYCRPDGEPEEITLFKNAFPLR